MVVEGFASGEQNQDGDGGGVSCAIVPVEMDDIGKAKQFHRRSSRDHRNRLIARLKRRRRRFYDRNARIGKRDIAEIRNSPEPISLKQTPIPNEEQPAEESE